MRLVRGASSSELPEGQVTEVEVAGKAFPVCHAGGEFFIFDGIGPHAGGPLGHGALKDHFLACPFHAWEFDTRTGEHDYDERVAVATFPVCVEGDGSVILPG